MKTGGLAPLPKGTAIENSHEILKLFKEHNLKIVLQGHLHIIEEIIVDGIHFITGGAVSGRWWKGPHLGYDEGFVVLDVSGENFKWFYETFGWKAKETE